MFMQPCDSMEEAKARMERILACHAENPVCFTALRETDEVIGLGGVFEKEPGVWSEAGLCIARGFQHRGFAGEMLTLLMDAVFALPEAETFFGCCIDSNLPSKNPARKYGFHYHASSEEIRAYDGQRFTIEEFCLSAGEWRARRNP